MAAILRRNIYSLTQEEVLTFIRGVKELKASPDTVLKENMYDIFVKTHSAEEVVHDVHQTPLFLPWHRAFLMDFERRLQHVLGDPSFGLPYWDWTDDASLPSHLGRLWDAEMLGSPDEKKRGRAPSPVVTGPFAFTSGWKTVPGASFQDQLERVLGNPNGDLVYPTLDTIHDLYSNYSEYDDFRRALEFGPHGNMHVWVGGQMSYFETSVNDPVFWLHHANIDRIWAQWQLWYPDSPFIAPGGYTDQTVMPPTYDTTGKMIVKNVLDAAQSMYQYQEEPLRSTHLLALFRGVDTDKLEVATTYVKENESLGWSDKHSLPDHYSDVGPALAYSRATREVVCVHRGVVKDENLYTTTRSAKGYWSPDTQLSRMGEGNYLSAGEPALTWFERTLICVHRGSTGDERLWYTTRNAYGGWSKDTLLTGPHWEDQYYSQAGPAVAVYQGKLICVHPGASDHDDFLWWTETTNGVEWSKDQPFGHGYSIAKPALVVFHGQLYCVHRGGGKNNGDLLYWNRFTGTGWTDDAPLDGHYSVAGPGLAVLDNVQTTLLACLHRGASGDRMLWYTTARPPKRNENLTWPLTWSEDTRIDLLSSTASPALMSILD